MYGSGSDRAPLACSNRRAAEPAAEDRKLDPELLDPWQKLIRIEILGRSFEVPENNLLLRQFQFLSDEIGYGRYCWNGECRYCEVRYTQGDGPEQQGLACRVKGVEGMKLTKLAAEIKYNLSDALNPPEQG